MSDDYGADAKVFPPGEIQLTQDEDGNLSATRDVADGADFMEIMLKTRHLYPPPNESEVVLEPGWVLDPTTGRAIRVFELGKHDGYHLKP